MSRAEELTLKIIEGTASAEDMDELEWAVASDNDELTTHIRLLQIESLLRGQRQDLDQAGPTMDALQHHFEQRHESKAKSRPETPVAQPSTRSPGEDRAVSARRRQRRRKQSSPVMLYVLFGIALLLVIVGYIVRVQLAGGQGRPANWVVVTQYEGRVAIDRGGTPKLAQVNSELGPGHLIRTHERSSVSVQYESNVIIGLAGETELALVKLADEDSVSRRMRVAGGRIDVNVGETAEDQQVFVETPHSLVTAGPAAFTVVVEKQRTTVRVATGSVTALNAVEGSSVELPSGQGAVVQAGQPMVARAMSADELPKPPPRQRPGQGPTAGTGDPTAMLNWQTLDVRPFMGDLRGDTLGVTGNVLRVTYEITQRNGEPGEVIMRLHSVDRPDVVQDIIKMTESGKGKRVLDVEPGNYYVAVTAPPHFDGEIEVQQAQK
jgi:hypothetical protein